MPLVIEAEDTGTFYLSLDSDRQINDVAVYKQGNPYNADDPGNAESDPDWGMYVFRLRSDSPVDYSAFQCTNYVEYTQYQSELTSSTDVNGNITGTEIKSTEVGYKINDSNEAVLDEDDNYIYTSRMYVPVNFSMYKSVLDGGVIPWTVPYAGTVTIDFSTLITQLPPAPFDPLETGKKINITLIVKKDTGQQVGKINSTITSSNSVGDDVTLNLENIDVAKGDRLFIMASCDMSELTVDRVTPSPESYFWVEQPVITYTDILNDGYTENATQNIYTRITEADFNSEPFSGGFRGWYYGRWRGNFDNGNITVLNPDDIKTITLTPEQANTLNELKGSGQVDENGNISGSNSSAAQAIIDTIQNTMRTFTGMSPEPRPAARDPLNSDVPLTETQYYLTDRYPDGDVGIWIGHSQDSWISKSMMCSTRIGKKNIDDELSTGNISSGNSQTSTATTAAAGRGIKKKSSNENNSVSFSFGVSFTKAHGTSKCYLDSFDLNGDSYPDIVKSGGSVQYTNMDGSMGSSISTGAFSGIRENSSDSWNLSSAIPGGVQPTMKIIQILGGGEPAGQQNASPSPEISLGGSLGHGETDTTADFVDVNGDGLPDRVTGSGETVRLNLGYKFGEAQSYISGGFRMERSATRSASVSGGYDSYGYGGGVSISTTYSATEKTLVDVNGDGLPDIVSKDVDTKVGVKSTGNLLKVAYNLGTSFSGVADWNGMLGEPIQYNESGKTSGNVSLTYKFPVFAFIAWLGFLNPNIAGSYGSTDGKTSAVFTDVNGDGLPDHVTPGRLSSAINQTGRTGLLKSVTRPLGGSIALDYERTRNTQDMPQSRWVLTKVTTDDGMAGIDAEGTHSFATSYTYEDGKYDRGWKDFYGFKTVTETMADNSTVVHTYLNTSVFNKGLETETIHKDKDEFVWSKIDNEYSYNLIIDGQCYFPALISKTTHYYEKEETGSIYQKQSYTYDTYGNVTAFTEEAAGTDTVRATITYHDPKENYVVAIPSQIKVNDGSGDTYRQRGANYDYKGNMTSHTVYTKEGKITTVLTYDAYGNITSVTYPTPGTERDKQYEEFYTYDTETNAYITQVTDSFGYASGARYDMRFGTPIVSVDMNRNSMYYMYDEFGRTVSVTGPYDTGGSPSVRYDYYAKTAGRPAMCVTKNKAYYLTNNYIETYTYADGLGRIIQTKKTGEKDGAPGLVISGKKLYDAMGRVEYEGKPRFNANDGHAYYVYNLDEETSTEYTYDDAGRRQGGFS